MNFNELLTSGANITLAVSLTDLTQIIELTVLKTKNELEDKIAEDKAERYLSPKEVATILDVDLSTLWRYGKRGYLVAIEIGGKRRYKSSAVNRILNGGKI